ncbi:hypothetical protein N2152v2_006694 [Parachlorella kessleri]
MTHATRQLALAIAAAPSCGPLPEAPRPHVPLYQAQQQQQQQQTSSYVRGATDVPLLHETIGQNLQRTAAAHPNNDALVSVHQAIRLTYRQFQEHVNEVARGLLALGVQRRDRVGVWAPNCAEWAVMQYATAKVGAVLVCINPAYRAAELSHVLRQAGVSVLVMAQELKGTSFPDLLESVEAPALKHRVVLGADPPEGYLDWYDLRWAGEGAGLARALAQREASLHPGDPINIQYTSGTTGLPKGAVLSHRNILNNGFFIGEGLGYGPADRVCIPVPLFHCFGLVLASLACTTHGATMVFPSDCFDPEACLAAVEAERCTSHYGVPTMFIAQLEHPRFGQYRLDSLRTGIMAGSTCPAEVMRRVRADMHMEGVSICYGMTETSPVSFQTGREDPVERRVSTVGRIQPHLEAKVVNPASKQVVVRRGEVGELAVRGYSVMLGYWDDAQATARCIDQEGWMHTGDLAVLDGEGYCRIVGRIKDMVIRGGENVYPREVEEFLHRHPAIADVQARRCDWLPAWLAGWLAGCEEAAGVGVVVFGVPDRKYGEELCAWVRLKEGSSGVTMDDLKAWCKGKIAHFKVPRYWKQVTSYPMTVSGKPQKYLMRAQAAAELGLEPATCQASGVDQALDAAAAAVAAAEAPRAAAATATAAAATATAAAAAAAEAPVKAAGAAAPAPEEPRPAGDSDPAGLEAAGAA